GTPPTSRKWINRPRLSPIQSAADAGELGSNGILPDVESLRIPVQYLANLLTAGDTQPVLLALKRMLAMRHYKRAETVDGVGQIAAGLATLRNS
ncbi:hypothetical protein FK513_31550, partial [Klebsiella pneumoniae]|nr:hypothetical protein [Klebsiella pneumoniae]